MIHPVQLAMEELKLAVPVTVETVLQEVQVTLSLKQGAHPAMLMQRMLEGNVWHILKLMQGETLLCLPAMVEMPRIRSTLSARFYIVILLYSSHNSLLSILMDRELI